MPQMAPLWWEYLFLSFSTLMMIMMIIIYHNPNVQPSKNTKMSKKMMNQMNWPW
nr:ATP synthase F0 subunit 8 [Megacopta cribraria]UYA97463.1 ATP synthase F0 subunit 8 [Megacopta cribraria]UYA97476.1 ATP synthase F0 subunit 8 [Megacopta cribraria]